MASVQIKLGLDPADPTRDPSECAIDTEMMKYDPLTFRFSHKDPATANRKLLGWLDEDLATNVRKNTHFFNTRISDYAIRVDCLLSFRLLSCMHDLTINCNSTIF